MKQIKENFTQIPVFTENGKILTHPGYSGS